MATYNWKQEGRDTATNRPDNWEVQRVLSATGKSKPGRRIKCKLYRVLVPVFYWVSIKELEQKISKLEERLNKKVILVLSKKNYCGTLVTVFLKQMPWKCIPLFFILTALPAKRKNRQGIAGIWKALLFGRVKNSPCHDETVVYYFTKSKRRKPKYSLGQIKWWTGKWKIWVYWVFVW